MPAAPSSAACTETLPFHATSVGHWPAIVILVAGLLAGANAVADQKDSRLDGLFAQLRRAATAQAAQPIEAEIWGIWMQSGDDKIDALMRSGIVALNENDYDKALQVFSRIAALAPDFAEGWNKRATTLYLMGRFTESIKDIDHVLRLEPRHFGALSGLGLCDTQLKKDRAALDAFERAAAVDPNLSGVKSNIAELKKRLAGQSI
jgi:tetratricopeptide (TPR) repeat protein